MKCILKISIFLFAGTIAMGCAMTKLERAEQSYSEARSDPMISRNAASTLNEAGRELETAQDAKTWEETEHHAYMAEKYIELAKVQASQSQASAQAAQLEQEQEQLMSSLQRQQAEQARREAEQAQRELQAYLGEQRRQQMQTISGDLLFGFDQAQLKEGAHRELEQLSGFLQNNPEHRVLVEGFTDSIGDETYNQHLAQQRAEAVAKVLEADGISPDRITARGIGEKHPVGTNETKAGRQENRRVEITILNPGQRPEDAGKGSGRM